jgi:hypothetical protein
MNSIKAAPMLDHSISYQGDDGMLGFKEKGGELKIENRKMYTANTVPTGKLLPVGIAATRLPIRTNKNDP